MLFHIKYLYFLVLVKTLVNDNKTTYKIDKNSPRL